MKEGKNEFLGLLCNLYLVILLAVLPLYTGDGYCQLGDTKYTLFRNLSFLCLGGWLLAGTPGRVRSVAEYLRAWKERCKGEYGTEAQTGLTGDGAVRSGRRGMETAGQKWRSRSGAGRKQAVFSSVDFAMMLYGICVIFSAVCSSYGELAWTGYEGWYMGAISQILFIGIYFFISRQYDGAAWPIYLGEAAFFLVTLLGLLHRLGIDPLGLMGNWNSGDWEYSHMLSTLGNINWLCGYYSVALAFGVVPWLFEERRAWRAARYVPAVSAYVLLGVQGSQGGLLILAVCTAVCLCLGRGRRQVEKRLCLLLTGFFLGMPLMGLLMELRGDRAAVVRDGNIFGATVWYGWVAAALVSLACFFLLGRGKSFRKKKKAGASVRGGFIVLAVLAALIMSAGVVGAVASRRLDDGFGSGRGFLWRIALESFAEANGKDMVLGAGPDCYGEAVFGRLGADAQVWIGEHWEGAVFTNAHNEFLSQLCNVGILGTICYSAIFLTGLWRYSGAGRRGDGGAQGRSEDWTGVLVLAMYGAHALVSFQQVLNAPLLFLALGLCEQRRRAEETKRGEWREQDEVEEIQN